MGNAPFLFFSVWYADRHPSGFQRFTRLRWLRHTLRLPETYCYRGGNVGDTDESVHGGMEPPYNPPLVTE